MPSLPVQVTFITRPQFTALRFDHEGTVLQPRRHRLESLVTSKGVELVDVVRTPGTKEETIRVKCRSLDELEVVVAALNKSAPLELSVSFEPEVEPDSTSNFAEADRYLVRLLELLNTSRRIRRLNIHSCLTTASNAAFVEYLTSRRGASVESLLLDCSALTPPQLASLVTALRLTPSVESACFHNNSLNCAPGSCICAVFPKFLDIDWRVLLKFPFQPRRASQWAERRAKAKRHVQLYMLNHMLNRNVVLNSRVRETVIRVLAPLRIVLLGKPGPLGATAYIRGETQATPAEEEVSDVDRTASLKLRKLDATSTACSAPATKAFRLLDLPREVIYLVLSHLPEPGVLSHAQWVRLVSYASNRGTLSSAAKAGLSCMKAADHVGEGEPPVNADNASTHAGSPPPGDVTSALITEGVEDSPEVTEGRDASRAVPRRTERTEPRISEDNNSSHLADYGKLDADNKMGGNSELDQFDEAVGGEDSAKGDEPDEDEDLDNLTFFDTIEPFDYEKFAGALGLYAGDNISPEEREAFWAQHPDRDMYDDPDEPIEEEDGNIPEDSTDEDSADEDNSDGIVPGPVFLIDRTDSDTWPLAVDWSRHRDWAEWLRDGGWRWDRDTTASTGPEGEDEWKRLQKWTKWAIPRRTA